MRFTTEMHAFVFITAHCETISDALDARTGGPGAGKRHSRPGKHSPDDLYLRSINIIFDLRNIFRITCFPILLNKRRGQISEVFYMSEKINHIIDFRILIAKY